jgi:asparagine synthase (glutamine-hydrolysing)
MGFQRLCVIDPAGSHQPMTDPASLATLAFNGEIYNYRRLRQQLQDGYTFRTDGDTEVILAGYLAEGPAFLSKLHGMFAIALYDARTGQLLLARDRFGQKPLYYTADDNKVLFASEAKAFRQRDDQRISLGEYIPHYLTAGYVDQDHCAMNGVRKVSPGSYLLCDPTPAPPQNYWQLTLGEVPPQPADAQKAVRNALRQAVEERLIADVPLGALLSGGIDSAVTVALMRDILGPDAPLQTFTAGFAEELYDERPLARRIAEHLRTDHTELLIEPDPEAMLDWVVEHYDEPFADSSAIPTHLVCQAARQHVTVALTGDGGDEAFAGYDRYRAMQLGQTMRPSVYFLTRVAGWIARWFAGTEQRSRLRRLARFAEGLGQPPAVAYFVYRRLFSPEDLLILFTDDFLAEHEIDVYEPLDEFCNLHGRFEQPSEVTNAQLHDIHHYLPGDLLTKADIASMAHSLELRSPFLDHRVMQLGVSLPTELKIRGKRGKAILRDAFADALPAEVFNQPKRGFGVPLAHWLRFDLRDQMADVLTDKRFRERGIFREAAIVGLVNDHVGGVDDHSHRLWALMVLARWLDKHA